jgi:hypothetical protein
MEAQMMFLTATLPPTEDIHIFWAPTSQPNIEYGVHEYKGVEEINAVHRLTKEKLDEHTAPGKIIVYSSSITMT